MALRPVARRDDAISRFAKLERDNRWKGDDDWIDLAQWLTEGHMTGDSVSWQFQRFQARRTKENWIELRGGVTWLGNIGNPTIPIEDDPDNAVWDLMDEPLIDTPGGSWSFDHGPLPEELRPQAFAFLAVMIDSHNTTGFTGALPAAMGLLVTQVGNMYWRMPDEGWPGSAVSLNLDGLRYYGGPLNNGEEDEYVNPEYVQWWPNPQEGESFAARGAGESDPQLERDGKHGMRAPRR